MLTSFEDFFKKQGPWAIVLEILAEVLFIAVVVGLTVVTGGGPPRDRRWRRRRGGRGPRGEVASEAAQAAEQVAQQLEEELPNVTMFEGWPQNMGTMPSFPGGWQFVYPIPFAAGN